MRLVQLINKPDMRKLFGKRELAIMHKQLKGVRLTQSEKNRLSRDIRKKISAAVMLSMCGDELRLKHGQEIMSVCKEAVEVILASEWAPRVQRIILFGSAADGTSTLMSDIDIAVDLGHISTSETTRFRTKLLGRLPPKIDIQVLNSLPEKIRTQASNGRVLYERANQRENQGNRTTPR